MIFKIFVGVMNVIIAVDVVLSSFKTYKYLTRMGKLCFYMYALHMCVKLHVPFIELRKTDFAQISVSWYYFLKIIPLCFGFNVL